MLIYDNTLREGAQNVQIKMTLDKKLAILDAQIEAGLKQIEIGFVAAGKDEENMIQHLLTRKNDADLYCLSRLNIDDVNKCLELGCKNITIFVPASDQLISAKLHLTVPEIEDRIYSILSYARLSGLKIRFSCEGATQTPLERLLKFYSIAEKCGAISVSVPDTLGISSPASYGKLFSKLSKNLKCNVSAHCHNDLGFALANAFSSVENGAKEIQVTINGIGDRIGNIDLIQTVLFLKKFYNDQEIPSLLNIKKLYEKFEKITGYEISPSFPILGKNQFVHESGLHVRALLNNSPYEAFPPEWIGEKHTVIYGQLSGSSNIEYFCRNNGIELSKNELKFATEKMKEMASSYNRYLTDSELFQIIKEVSNDKKF